MPSCNIYTVALGMTIFSANLMHMFEIIEATVFAIQPETCLKGVCHTCNLFRESPPDL